MALSVGRSLVDKAPTDPEAHMLLAGACLQMGLSSEAVQSARRAMRLDPGKPKSYEVLSKSLTNALEWDEAMHKVDQGLHLEPDNEELIAHKAFIMEKKGQLKEAFDWVRPLIQGRSTFNLDAVRIFTTIVRRYGAEKEAADLLELARNKPGLPQGTRCVLHFQTGDMYQALGEHDAAFQAYRAGNELKPRKYDPRNAEEFFLRLKEQFSAEFFRFAPTSGHESKRPIFIVGMPRSGTSLVEQILASHPLVFGGGELSEIGRICEDLPRKMASQKEYPECVRKVTYDILCQVAEEYFSRLQDLDTLGHFRFTDKLPQNFLHLGLIALMFPRASFVHIRRDPMDTCLSCYFQNFVAQGLTFAYDLESLGHYYRLYEELMSHWRSVLPVQMLEVQYEHLLEDTENQISSLLEFCDLEWNNACLDFHLTQRVVKTASYGQVRQPLYTSSMRKWKKYEKHLEPLKRSLGLKKV